MRQAVSFALGSLFISFLVPIRCQSLFWIAAGTLYGPLHSQQGIDAYLTAVNDAKKAGGTIAYGGKARLFYLFLFFGVGKISVFVVTLPV